MVDKCALNEQLLRYGLQALLMEPYFHAQLYDLIGVSGALGVSVNTDNI